MNARLSMQTIAARLSDGLATKATVGTAYQRSYWKDASTAFPGVWIGGQTLSALSDGRGFSGLMRQRVRVEFGVRVVVQRAAAGVTDPEAALNTLADQVAALLLGWRPDGADVPLVWMRTQDEAPQETVLSAVLMFATESTYQAEDAA